MIVTILYSLWIAYTVFSLGILFGFVGLSYWAAWENIKHQNKIREMMNEDLEGVEEEDLFSPNQQPQIK